MSRDSSSTWKVAVASAALAVAATKCVEIGWKKYQLQNIADASTKSSKKLMASDAYDDTLFREQLARNYAFLGEDGMEKVKNQYIVVVGAGGVGSWVVTMLVRSGVRKIRVIDFDQVSLSSLNRHSCANLKDVGTSKVLALKKHMAEIAPWCEIDAVNELWDLANSERLTMGNGRPDMVVDCIDNIDTKVDLLAYLHENKIDMISSMGASATVSYTHLTLPTN